MRNIPFNKPANLGSEYGYVADAVKRGRLSGDGYYTKGCQRLIEEKYHAKKVLLTGSCTHSLEMAALLCDIKPGDEVIMPSFTFVSTANAFVLRGARIVFVDIRPDTQNMDETLVEHAITDRTKVIVPVHYAGVACEMNAIKAVAEQYKLKIVEDAAQGVHAFYEGIPLGTIGDIGCYSFHETKNYTMGEGGASILNCEDDFLRAEIIREKGTNRTEYLLGMADKYTWKSKGSSYLPSDISSAYLYGQLLESEKINTMRMERYNQYYANLRDLQDKEKFVLPYVPDNCTHNAHMFYLKTRSFEERCEIIAYLREKGIVSTFHYIPLHSSQQGRKTGIFAGEDKYTTVAAETLLRLPMFADLTGGDVDYICEHIYDFYRER